MPVYRRMEITSPHLLVRSFQRYGPYILYGVEEDFLSPLGNKNIRSKSKDETTYCFDDIDAGDCVGEKR